MFLLNIDIPPQFEDQICVYAQGQLGQLGKSSSGNKSSNDRDQRVRTEALRIGASIGGSKVWKLLMDTMDDRKYQVPMDQMFNFGYLRYDWQMLPPVIQSAEQSANLIGSQQLVTTDQVFEIVSPARLITATPTWRDYFAQHRFTEARPSRSLLPANSGESSIWKEGLCEGAKHGARFAINEYAEVLSKLTRDYKGMLLYKELELAGVVNPPRLQSEREGVVQNGRTLVVNKTRYIIASQSQFQRPESWNRPVMQVDYQVPNFDVPAHIKEPTVLRPEEADIVLTPGQALNSAIQASNVQPVAPPTTTPAPVPVAAPAPKPVVAAQPVKRAAPPAVKAPVTTPAAQVNAAPPAATPVQPAVTINPKAKEVKLRKKTKDGFFSDSIAGGE